MDAFSIAELRKLAAGQRIEGSVHAQVEALTRREASNGKPFFDVTLADAEGKLPLKAWNDTPAFSFCESARPGMFVEVVGEFATGKFGLEAARWTARELRVEEKDALLGGGGASRERQIEDYHFIESSIAAVTDPRLRHLCLSFLDEYGERFRRAAAARANHHARRGGLVEHVAQMIRAVAAMAATYPSLNRDLLVAGVLFHDCGKLWENQLPPDGFTMPYNEHGELLGHIAIGLEVVNLLWRKLAASDVWREWLTLEPPNEDVRLHLLHLVASHHGSLEFGSPVVPKTPEAWLLHYVDNIDAKLEMMKAAYAGSRQLARRIQEKVWPLPGNLVEPLRPFSKTAE